MSVVPKPKPATVWLTRDSNHVTGILAEYIKVWLDRPTRFSYEKGVYWMCNDDDKALWGTYSPANAQSIYGTIPDDDRQIIRNGLLKHSRKESGGKIA